MRLLIVYFILVAAAALIGFLAAMALPATGQLITKDGISVELVGNTDQCDTQCFSVYRVCGAPGLIKSEISVRYDVFMGKDKLSQGGHVKDTETTVTEDKGCYLVRVEGTKSKYANVDNVPTFRGQEFPEFAWWNSSWKTKTGYAITVSNGMTLTDYTVDINVTKEAGETNFPDDTRWLSNDNSTELAYWVEKNTTEWALIWVEVDQINGTVWRYFNNSDAESESDIFSAGIDGDDFEDGTNNWTKFDSGDTSHYSESDGNLVLTQVNPNWDEGIFTAAHYYNVSARIRYNTTSPTTDAFAFGTGATGAGSNPTADHWNNNNNNNLLLHRFNSNQASFSEFNDWGVFEQNIPYSGNAYAYAWSDNGSLIGNHTLAPASRDVYIKMVAYTTSTPSYVDWIFIRKFESHVEPEASPGEPEEYVSDNFPDGYKQYPEDGSRQQSFTVDFNCSAEDDLGLESIDLWYSGAGFAFHENQTSSVTGLWNYSVFTVTFKDTGSEEEIDWNCLITDNSSQQKWADATTWTTTLELQNYTEPNLESETWEATETGFELSVGAWSSTIASVDAYFMFNGDNMSYDDLDTGGSFYNFSVSVWPNLTETNGTATPYYWHYIIEYNNGSTLEFNTTEGSIPVWWGVWPSSATPSDPVVSEGENVTITVTVEDESDGGMGGEGDPELTYNVTVWFNDAEYETSAAGGGTYEAEVSTSGLNGTVYFNGSVEVSYYGATYIRNTTSGSITIQDIILTNCSADSESQTETLHFYLYIENTDTPLTSDMEAAFDVWVDPESVSSFAFNLSGQNNYSICIFPTWATYQSDMMSQFSAPGYSPRTYYLANATLTNTSQEIDLYLEQNTTTDLITMQVLNAQGLPQEDVYINIARYNIGTNTYSTVAILKTDFDGKAYSYLTKNTVWYRFTLIQDGEVRDQYSPTIITEDTLTFQLTQGELGEYFNYYDQVAFNCTWPNNTTTCTVTDTSGLMQEATLEVKRWTSLGYIDVCSDSDTASSVTLVCSMGVLTGRVFWYELTSEFENTEMVLESGYLDYRTGNPEYGSLGVLAALALLMVLAFIGYTIGPEAGMALSGVSVILSWSVGLIVVALAAVMGFLVVAAIGIYVHRSRNV